MDLEALLIMPTISGKNYKNVGLKKSRRSYWQSDIL